MLSFLLTLIFVSTPFTWGNSNYSKGTQNTNGSTAFESRRGFENGYRGSRSVNDFESFGFDNDSEISGSGNEDVSNLLNFTSKKIYFRFWFKPWLWKL